METSRSLKNCAIPLMSLTSQRYQSPAQSDELCRCQSIRQNSVTSRLGSRVPGIRKKECASAGSFYFQLNDASEFNENIGYWTIYLEMLTDFGRLLYARVYVNVATILKV